LERIGQKDNLKQLAMILHVNGVITGILNTTNARVIDVSILPPASKDLSNPDETGPRIFQGEG
jgi:hypothetical protein